MPKVSKLVSLKLEKHFNDARAEKNFFTSGEFKLNSESPVNQMAKIKQEYFRSLVDLEEEKKKYYLNKYNAALRENQKQFLEEVEEFLGDCKGKTSSTKGTARSDADEVDGPKTDKTTTVYSDSEDENLDSKSEAAKSSVSKKTRMTILSSRSRSRLLPEISVPICDGGKITPKLKDSPKRKTAFLEAERVVRDANGVYAEAQMQAINDIYRYRVRDHSLKAPTKGQNKHRRDPAKRFHMHLHAGTILKAPKLCADAEKILSMNEKRSLEQEDRQPEYDDQKVFVSQKGNLFDLLPKGDGVLEHLPGLLGVDMESLAKDDADEYDGEESAEVVIELEGGDHEPTKTEDSVEEGEGSAVQSSEEEATERWDADVDGATISSVEGKSPRKLRKFVSKKERDEKHASKRCSESSSDEETVTETVTGTKSVTPLAFKRVDSSSIEMSKQIPASTLQDEDSVSHPAEDRRSDTDAISQVQQVQERAVDVADQESLASKVESKTLSQDVNNAAQVNEEETVMEAQNQAIEEPRSDVKEVTVLEVSHSEDELQEQEKQKIKETTSEFQEKDDEMESKVAVSSQNGADDFFDDVVISNDTEIKKEEPMTQSSLDETKLEKAPNEEIYQTLSAVIKEQDDDVVLVQQSESVVRGCNEKKLTQQIETEQVEEASQDIKREKNENMMCENKVLPEAMAEEKTNSDPPVSVEKELFPTDVQEASEKIAENEMKRQSSAGDEHPKSGESRDADVRGVEGISGMPSDDQNENGFDASQENHQNLESEGLNAESRAKFCVEDVRTEKISEDETNTHFDSEAIINESAEIGDKITEEEKFAAHEEKIVENEMRIAENEQKHEEKEEQIEENEKQTAGNEEQILENENKTVKSENKIAENMVEETVDRIAEKEILAPIKGETNHIDIVETADSTILEKQKVNGETDSSNQQLNADDDASKVIKENDQTVSAEVAEQKLEGVNQDICNPKIDTITVGQNTEAVDREISDQIENIPVDENEAEDEAESSKNVQDELDTEQKAEVDSVPIKSGKVSVENLVKEDVQDLPDSTSFDISASRVAEQSVVAEKANEDAAKISEMTNQTENAIHGENVSGVDSIM